MKNNQLVQGLDRVSHFHVPATSSRLGLTRVWRLSWPIVSEWVAPLIACSIAVAMCLAIIAVLLFATE